MYLSNVMALVSLLDHKPILDTFSPNDYFNKVRRRSKLVQVYREIFNFCIANLVNRRKNKDKK